VGDIVADEATGLLTPEAPEAFMAGIARLVGDPALCRRMGQQARQMAASYAIEHTSQMMLEHYQRLVAGRPTA
jgi:glycosyltransferase involved in cell wall biosynthesis